MWAECGEPLYLRRVPEELSSSPGLKEGGWERSLPPGNGWGGGLPPGRRDRGLRASASASRARDPSWGSRLSEPCGQRRRPGAHSGWGALQGAGWRRRGPTGADERRQGQQGFHAELKTCSAGPCPLQAPLPLQTLVSSAASCCCMGRGHLDSNPPASPGACKRGDRAGYLGRKP